MDIWMYLSFFLLGGLSLEASAQKTACPVPELKNGRVRIRGGGRMAYFRCKKKFKRVGNKLAVCLSSGNWSQKTPVCVGRGCPDLGALPNVSVTEMYKGGILQFTCPEGMRREGPQQLMCDGTNWSDKPPKCLYGVSLGCDFEDASLCGWSQDTEDDFDWTWTSGATPTADTGPDGDHTTGSGHYVFMESSAPQKSGQVARLISPPYHPNPDLMCMNFFYHMKGPDKNNEVGDLDVYVRTGKDDAVKDVSVFHRNGFQGNDWILGQVTIPMQQDVYRIVFAATRRESWSGDIALDDIRVLNCSEMAAETTPLPDKITTIGMFTTKPPRPAITTMNTTNTQQPPTTTTTTTTTTNTPTTATTSTTTTTTTTTTPTTTTTTTEPTTTTMLTTQPTSPTSTTTTTIPTSTTTTTTTTTPQTTSTTFTSTSTPTTSTAVHTDGPSTITTVGGTTATTDSPRTTSVDSKQDSSTTPAIVSSVSSSSSSSSPGTTTDVYGSGSSGDYIRDYTDGEESPTDTRSASSSQGAGPGLSDYLPLIIGVSLGVAVGVAVVGVLAWLWTRNKRKQKALRVEEDQLNIIGSIEPSSYSYPPSGSEH